MDIYTFCLYSNGSLEYIYTLAKGLNNINQFDSKNAKPSEQFKLREAIKFKNYLTTESVIYSTTLRPKQNIFDIVLTGYGSLKYLSSLVEDNNLKTLTEYEGKPIGIKIRTRYTGEAMQELYIYDKSNWVATNTRVYGGDYNNDYNNDYKK